MKNRTPTSRKWPCQFSTKWTPVSDLAVDEMWKAEFGGKTPFGDLRNQWRREHCRTLNPYGSESCPYAPDICLGEFVHAVQRTVDAHPRVPVGYFRKVARSSAARRADEKPLARDSTKVLTGQTEQARVGTDVSNTEAERERRLGGPSPTTTAERQGVRSPASGPVSIGEVLRSLDLRSRPPELRDEGKEGTE